MTELPEQKWRRPCGMRGPHIVWQYSEAGGPVMDGWELNPDFLDAARAEPPPSYDGSKSLGERLQAAAVDARLTSGIWRLMTDDGRGVWERTALNFTARLSDAKEDNRASRSQPVSGAVGQDSDTGKVSG